jgi:TrmH family RNA methyltransferase
MANTGHHQLLLVEPAALFGDVARRFAVGAHHVLDFAARHGSLAEALAPFRRVVATTSTRDRKLEVPLLTPHELPALLAEDPPDLPTAIVFGPEVGGLTGDELTLAHVIVHIPCAPEQPTLNLSQAVLIVGYELFQARRAAGEAPSAPPGAAAPFAPATTAEVEGLFGHVGEVLGAVGFDRDDSFDGVMRDLRQLAGRTDLSVREVRILRGICRRTANALAGKGS